jgi:hypothetical protein
LEEEIVLLLSRPGPTDGGSYTGLRPGHVTRVNGSLDSVRWLAREQLSKDQPGDLAARGSRPNLTRERVLGQPLSLVYSRVGLSDNSAWFNSARIRIRIRIRIYKRQSLVWNVAHLGERRLRDVCATFARRWTRNRL